MLHSRSSNTQINLIIAHQPWQSKYFTSLATHSKLNAIPRLRFSDWNLLGIVSISPQHSLLPLFQSKVSCYCQIQDFIAMSRIAQSCTSNTYLISPACICAALQSYTPEADSTLKPNIKCLTKCRLTSRSRQT